jgi:hypothetical protein
LARGIWVAPPWAFYGGIAAVVVAALFYFGYLARRAGLLSRRRPRTRT